MKRKQLCRIYDCEWDEYYDGVIIDNTVHDIDEKGNILPTKELAWEAWDNIIPLMQFYIGDYDREQNNKGRDDSNKDSAQWGFFHLHTGEIIVPPIYDCVYPFYSNCAKVIKHRKYGFVSCEGRLIVDTVWDEADDFTIAALCPVRKGDKWGYIDKNGTEIFSPQFESAEALKPIHKYVGESYERYYAALVVRDGKYGFIDDKGNYIFEPKFDDARSFWSEGYALVMGYGKWGFLDHTGAMAVPLQFEAVGEEGVFEIPRHVVRERKNGMDNFVRFYTVNLDGPWGIMDSDFNIIMPDGDVNYIIYKGMKLYIKKGRNTSKRIMK